MRYADWVDTVCSDSPAHATGGNLEIIACAVLGVFILWFVYYLVGELRRER